MIRQSTLRVPGATLHHELRGAGPVLLLLPGAGGDAAVLDPVADTLADTFTVLTHDPRGYSRSALDGPHTEQRVEVHADDARRLLDAVSPGEPAYVAGASSGAIVALGLLARHPGRVRRAVAHEPPSWSVLPDAAEQLAFFDEVHELFTREGQEAAGERFLRGIGGAMGAATWMRGPELPPRTREMLLRLAVNAPLAVEHEYRSFAAYVPDLDALATVRDRLTLAYGEETRPHLPHRPAALMAARLGLAPAVFPGAHNGWSTHPAETADLLRTRLLGDTR
ncbi:MULTISPECIES: alpha/beta hydrolase [unclassified Streptomyces]|uniref:alpha/beta hydrolase n=1 Tax=unclassified Streptomyces TaxID=2593676 RepID=UPI000DBA6327|nr:MULTISPECIES: alpha/beta hydrolase [unclassified Streptomyces]MYT68541.1 alpha/beta fold hydrolase [Streptomyces sp. SID8367]RAJ86213.1 pimeloyl-ACP methyl ester carboxylesterase [Streptomyces sp. PsTaAH-137]